MISPRRPLAALLLACPLMAVVLAQTPQAPVLDVRMGLWEMTNTIDFGGQMPGMDTSKMTPQQQAQMAAAMRGMMTPRTNTVKSCITREDFDRKNFISEQDKNCKQTFTKNTKTLLEGTIACTGERAMSGTLHIEAPTPTAFSGNMKSTSTERGRTMTMNLTMAGKWLAAQCGDVK
jgi:hypothetical protein